MLKKLTISLIVLSFIFWSCSDDKPNWPGPDTEAPAAITNLMAGDSTTASLKLTWTAPGDNGNIGRAAAYGIGYFKDTISDTTWETSQNPGNIPIPSAAGSAESLLVGGLDPNSKYYFVIVAVDEVGNQSPLSNIAEGFTDNDSIAPSAITDLIILDSTISGISLSWTAPGDDTTTGTINQYTVKYDTMTITVGSWDSATTYSGTIIPQTAGSNETLIISGLNSGTTYYFAVRATDELNNLSDISNIASAMTRPLTAVNDLTVLDPLLKTTTEISLTWTSPGDDSIYTTATGYDLRYVVGVAADTTAFDWANAIQCINEPTPSTSGAPDTFEVDNLSYDTIYTFALRTTDDVGNFSPFSNLYIDSTLWSRFGMPINYGVGDEPSAIIAIDLDGDNDSDLVVANGASDNITVLKNNGTGNPISLFDNAANYNANNFPISIALADLYNNSRMDLAVANYTPDSVGGSIGYLISILPNNGSGGFNAAAKHATGGTGPPSSIISADFNDDGWNDLALTEWTNDSILVMLNDSGAVFPDILRTRIAAGGTSPWAIHAADFNADGDIDLSCANLHSNNVTIYLNNGHDTTMYDAGVNYSVGSRPYSIASADFDKDGNIDLVTANNGSHNISVLFGNGDGTFLSAVNNNAGMEPYSMYVTDLNDDTYMDVAVINVFSSDISVLLNDSTGAFPNANRTSYAAGDDPLIITGGDFDEDGTVDLVTGNQATDSVSVLINKTE